MICQFWSLGACMGNFTPERYWWVLTHLQLLGVTKQKGDLDNRSVWEATRSSGEADWQDLSLQKTSMSRPLMGGSIGDCFLLCAKPIQRVKKKLETGDYVPNKVMCLLNLILRDGYNWFTKLLTEVRRALHEQIKKFNKEKVLKKKTK